MKTKTKIIVSSAACLIVLLFVICIIILGYNQSKNAHAEAPKLSVEQIKQDFEDNKEDFIKIRDYLIEKYKATFDDICIFGGDIEENVDSETIKSSLYNLFDNLNYLGIQAYYSKNTSQPTFTIQIIQKGNAGPFENGVYYSDFPMTETPGRMDFGDGWCYYETWFV